jgi:2-dehydropantoate 2-reductase
VIFVFYLAFVLNILIFDIMKIAIIGTGGVGGYFGGRMAAAGYDVTFLARGKHLEAIRENGLKVKSILGDFLVKHAMATESIKEIGKVDLVIICVKAWQLKGFAGELKKIVSSDTVILPVMNGILASEELKEHVSEKQILGGLCRIISKIESPGVINHTGIDPEIIFGEADNRVTSRVTEIKEIFDKSGIKSKVAEDIQAEIWKKYIGICVSGLLAVNRSTYGEIRELQVPRQMMIELMREIHTLSQKMGVRVDPLIVEATMNSIDSYPYDSSPSMARDVWEGKPSEIEYQNGTVVRLAEKYGISVPINRFVYYCILPMEIRARRKQSVSIGS